MSNDEDFNNSGLSGLTAIDWENSDHRRKVMASLVQGVYVLQSDKEKGRGESQALAPRWWQFLHSELIKRLPEEENKPIYGAVYQLNPSFVASKSPQFVVAFRGTHLKSPGTACCQDVKLDINIFFNKLQTKTRVKQALQSVRHLDSNNPQLVAETWLAGHSLGAAIALLVGKKMAKDNRKLETYLFNPPIMPSCINRGPACLTVCLCFANITYVVWDFLLCRRNPFDKIRTWKPHLYVHPQDLVCKWYIDYFENRNRLGKIDETASRVWRGPRWMCCSEVEPMHLLASAELTVNNKWFSCMIDAHAIQQWWNAGQDISEPKAY